MTLRIEPPIGTSMTPVIPEAAVTLSLERKLQIGFSSAVLLVILIGVTCYRTTQKLISTNREVEHSQAILSVLQATLSSMKDIETGERGYIITGDARFLEPHAA